MEVRAIRESERDEVLRLWQTVFSSAGEGFFERYFYGDVEWLPYYTQVCEVDGRIVSAVQIVRRSVACGDFRLTMGGIANVATLPDFRGQGYNTACLRAAIAVMEADAMDFSLLFTGIRDYYARQGYSSIAVSTVQGPVSPESNAQESGETVRAAQEADLPAIRAIYEGYNRIRPIAVQRTPAYWRDWMRVGPQRLEERFLVCVDASGVVVGYVTFAGGADEVFLTELGLGPDANRQAEIAASLVNAAARKTSGDAPALSARIAFDAPVRQALKSALKTEDWRTEPGGMMRLLHGENLLRSFALELNARWTGEGRPGGILDFATPYGTTRLDATGTFLRVYAVETTNAAAEREKEDDANGGEDAPQTDAKAILTVLPQETLFGLLFGLQTPEQATLDPTQQELIAALFPPHDSVYWYADGF